MVTKVMAVMVLTAATAAAEPVTLQNATATRSQAVFGNWFVSETIDGNFIGDNGWAIAFGLEPFGPQTAVFETSRDLGSAGGTKLTFTLTQTYADSHTLGRFRISVTTDDRSTFANGLQTGGDVTANWVVLSPAEVSATGGAVLTIQGDGSVRASGPNPARSVYTVVASTNLAGITGIRLEALQDAGFPFNGPGRATNGNFVLTEFQVDAVTADADRDGVPDDEDECPQTADGALVNEVGCALVLSLSVDLEAVEPSGLAASSVSNLIEATARLLDERSRPISNRDVNFSASVASLGSAGHAHGVPAPSASGYVDDAGLEAVSCTTDSDGECVLNYLVPIVSGDYSLEARTSSVTATPLVVQVRVALLCQIDRRLAQAG